MSDQIPLIGPRGGLKPRPPTKAAVAGTERVPVLLESPLPQLDRPFDFSVPPRLAGKVAPGVRVRATLGGRRHAGYVLPGGPDPQYTGPVRPLDAVVSPVPVLSPEVLELCRAVAQHYAGGLSDVVRLAVPPRVAGAESDWSAAPSVAPAGADTAAMRDAKALVAPGQRGVWTCPPATDWAEELAVTAATAAASGRGVLIVLPDGRDVERVADRLTRQRAAATAVLQAEAGATQRYRSFLSVLSGEARVVVGTRAAAFAPVADLGLAIIWDDGDPSHSDPHAPYPHAREVLVLRSHLSGCGLLIAGRSRSCEAQRLVERGWAAEVGSAGALRRNRPRVSSTEDRVFSPLDLARRFPETAVRTMRSASEFGPVLIHVARAGYVPVTACQNCREPATCPVCGGSVELTAGGPACRRCGAADDYRCPECGSSQLRAVRVGAQRTAEEVSRLLPDRPVLLSTAESVPAAVPGDAVVIATPGVEPEVTGGYAAAYLPDAQNDLWLPDSRAAENALRKWINAAALVRPGAPVVINADPGDEAVQALIRWDPVGFARRELAHRREAGLPPASRWAQLDGAEEDVTAVAAAVQSQLPQVHVLGPRPLDEGMRALLSSPDATGLATALRRAVTVRAGAPDARPVRVQMDPPRLD